MVAAGWAMISKGLVVGGVSHKVTHAATCHVTTVH